jgi:CheY-like chemotaxis protein
MIEALRCFVVDDNEIDLFTIRRLADSVKVPYALEVFTNGKLAFDAFKACVEDGVSPPQLVLLDLNMPVWDGWDFLDEIQQLNLSENPKVYIMSSSVDPADKKKAKSYSYVADFVVKPLTHEVIQRLMAIRT